MQCGGRTLCGPGFLGQRFPQHGDRGLRASVLALGWRRLPGTEYILIRI